MHKFFLATLISFTSPAQASELADPQQFTLDGFTIHYQGKEFTASNVTAPLDAVNRLATAVALPVIEPSVQETSEKGPSISSDRR